MTVNIVCITSRGIEQLPSSHTSENIYITLNFIAETWNINNKIFVAVTDNDTNIKNQYKYLQI